MGAAALPGPGVAGEKCWFTLGLQQRQTGQTESQTGQGFCKNWANATHVLALQAVPWYCPALVCPLYAPVPARRTAVSAQCYQERSKELLFQALYKLRQVQLGHQGPVTTGG